jgi:hypothetical protein
VRVASTRSRARGCRRARAARPRARAPRAWTSPGGGRSPRRSGRRPCRPGSATSSAPGRSSRCGSPRIFERISLVEGQQVACPRRRSPAGDAPGGRHEPQDREGGDALPAAGLADDAERLAPGASMRWANRVHAKPPPSNTKGRNSPPGWLSPTLARTTSTESASAGVRSLSRSLERTASEIAGPSDTARSAAR